MRIIYAKNYNEVRDLCHNVKESKPCPGLPVFYDEASAAMPVKAVLVPMPGSGGIASYTNDMAHELAMSINRQSCGKTAVVLNCLVGSVRDSVCRRKEAGEPFDDIEFGFRFVNEEAKVRLEKFIRAGWDVILVDNVIDTGTTARAAMQNRSWTTAPSGRSSRRSRRTTDLCTSVDGQILRTPRR